METLTSNAMAGTRRAKLNGRDYIVRNLRLIVPGVLPGSMGPLLYNSDVVSRELDAWNGMPLVAYHPKSKGSARTPEVLDKQGLGFAFRASFDGALISEGWFDVENVKRVDEGLPAGVKLLPRLEASEPVELSTGLYTVHNAAKGKHNGRDYIGVIQSMKPDHVAILPDQVGACSLKDGCGVVVNGAFALGGDGIWRVSDVSTKGKRRGLRAAIRDALFGEASKIAEQEAAMAKKDTVGYIVANCDCWKGQEAELEKLSEPQLDRIKQGIENSRKDAELLTAVRKKHGAAITANQFMKEEEEETEEEKKKREEEEEAKKKAAAAATTNKADIAKLVAEMVAATVANLQVSSEKAKLIDSILVNVAEDKRPTMRTAYEKLSVDELKAVKDAIPTPDRRVPLYNGAAAGKPAEGKKAESKPLVRPRPFRDKEFAKKLNRV